MMLLLIDIRIPSSKEQFSDRKIENVLNSDSS